jgi:hypothetical protein
MRLRMVKSTFLLSCIATANFAQVATPREGDAFLGLAGSWAGGGSVAFNGRTEKIRCRVSYAVSGNKSGLNQTLLCASDSYRFDIASSITERDGRLSGQWTEKTRNIVGSVTGAVRGNSISTQVQAPGFTASLNITTSGNKQNVTIRPANYEVSEIAISLSRAR